MGESLSNGGDIFGVRKTICTSLSLTTNNMINIRVGILELGNKVSRQIEDRDLGKPSTQGHTQRSPR